MKTIRAIRRLLEQKADGVTSLVTGTRTCPGHRQRAAMTVLDLTRTGVDGGVQRPSGSPPIRTLGEVRDPVGSA